MIKKNLKFLTVLLVILAIISSFSICFAEETNQNNETTSEAKTEETISEDDIYKGDLYLFGNNLKMDQLVDGNVYILGNNIEVTGQVNGSLFAFGRYINFDGCYIKDSVYACADKINYNAYCNDLYIKTNSKFEMAYDGLVARDVRATSKSAIIKAAIGRDVNISAQNIDLGNTPADGTKAEKAIIYGNLNYSSYKGINIEDGIVEGEINFSNNVINIIIGFIVPVITSLVIFALINKFKKDELENSNYSPIKLLKALLAGIITIILGSIVSVLLFMTVIGVKLAFVIVSLLVLAGLLAKPLVAIYLAKLIKVEKKSISYLILALISIVIYGLTLIPFYIGTIISAIISLIGYGLIVLKFIPKKKLSDEEKQALLERKQAKAELKAERKAQKAEKKAENNIKKDKKTNEKKSKSKKEDKKSK